MASFNDLDIFQKLGKLLSRPEGRPASWNQMARLARASDDAARRAVQRLEAHTSSQLIVSVNHRLTLSEAGKKLLHLAEEFSALAEQTEAPPECLTVQADSLLVENLFPQALAGFLELWGSAVRMRIFPLDSEVSNNIREGTTAFGLGFADGSERIPPAEILGPPAPWVLLIPRTHRLQNHAGPVGAADLSLNDRVFLPPAALTLDGFAAFLAAVSLWNCIECEAMTAARLAAAGLGLAIVPDLEVRPLAVGVIKLAIEGAQALQPRLFLPRQGAAGLSEPQQSLIDELLKVSESRLATEPALPAVEPLGANGSPAQHPLLSLEGK